MVDKEAEFGLVACPMRRTVEREAEEDDVDGSDDRCWAEEGAAQEGEDQQRFEDRRAPGQKQRERKTGGGDVASRCAHIHELERNGHQEDSGEDQAGDENGGSLPD
ncbi:hypothetical protein RHSP_38316 [Rhizobium freirei PRF 81]|uniref:Uncharacterized protein n=1 Tax=Rhizobium freirei PRF 81 TaxID=363754 RepID=N6VAJ5_9HYPH|nr:hypothetical protein RHSP_38316 [Rhizobium freirei PRF 81]